MTVNKRIKSQKKTLKTELACFRNCRDKIDKSISHDDYTESGQSKLKLKFSVFIYFLELNSQERNFRKICSLFKYLLSCFFIYYITIWQDDDKNKKSNDKVCFCGHTLACYIGYVAQTIALKFQFQIFFFFKIYNLNLTLLEITLCC